MIPKKTKDILISDIESLIDNSVPEGKTLEYKEELKISLDKDKKEFLADVSSFANALGGDLIFGIKSIDGLPVSVCGIEVLNQDDLSLKIDSILQSGINPRIKFEIKFIDYKNSKQILIIRVEQGIFSPHRIVFQNHGRFFTRSSAGKSEMDVTELRAAFNNQMTIEQKILDFKNGRLEILEKGAVRGKIILHIIPYQSFASRTYLDPKEVHNLYMNPSGNNMFAPISHGGGWSDRINLLGFQTYSGKELSANLYRTYLQIFKNGTVEAVENDIIDSCKTRSDRKLPMLHIEAILVERINKYLELLKEFGINPPFYVFITYTHIDDCIYMDSDKYDVNRTNVQDLELPEAVINSFDDDIPTALRASFDTAWHAIGAFGSPSYEKGGQWYKEN